MREKRVDTGLVLGRVEVELRLAAFLQNGVVTGDRDFSESFVGCEGIAEYGVI